MATGKRALANMQSRLANMVRLGQQGRHPTVAQISAAYSAMATSDNEDTYCWETLLALANSAIGVLETCLECRGSGTVTGKGEPECPKCGTVASVRTGLVSCTCMAGVTTPKGFARVPCHVCNGSGQRRIHNPAPAELPGNINAAQLNIAKQREGRREHHYLIQQVAAALERM